MLIRREAPSDAEAIRLVHASAFADPRHPHARPAEVDLVDALRADESWLAGLSLVALRPGVSGTEPAAGEGPARVVGHVVCTRAWIGTTPVLGLGPLGVHTQAQRGGVGHALMHAVLGAADALDEPLVALLGHADYYLRFGFRPSDEYGIAAPVAEWARENFVVRTLSAYDPAVRGTFRYADPFAGLSGS